jgi:small subunit ribosomal protein S1
VLGIEAGTEPGKPERIRLSLKALQTDPWNAAQKGLSKGSLVHGKVVRLETFGAFVELPDGLEGLLHVSEMVEGRRLNHAREVLSVGQEIDACVVEVDPSRRRIGLSLKALAAHQEAELAATYRPASSHSLGTFADVMKKKLGK